MPEPVPSPADSPQFTAEEFLDRIVSEGGKVFRMKEAAVFVITKNPELAQWLLSLKASPYLPRGMTPTYETPRGAYRDAKGGPLKWDIYIHAVPVKGEETIWEAARRRNEYVTKTHAVEP